MVCRNIPTKKSVKKRSENEAFLTLKNMKNLQEKQRY
jgi:hypothetical protein